MLTKKLLMGLVLFALTLSTFSVITMESDWKMNTYQSVKYDLNCGLVAYWNFDEGSGNILHDVSGHGNDGTIHSATWVQGVKGSALRFDGTHSFVDCGNNTSLNVYSAITIAAWFHPITNGWKYVRPIYLDPATPKENYQVKIELNTSNFDYSKVRPDGGDLRFYQEDGTKLNYWLENWNPHGTSIIWVKVATKGTKKIYMYYGNLTATTESSGTATFDFFDDFEKYSNGTDIDGQGGWITKRIGGTGEATIRVENGKKYLHISSTDKATSVVHAVNTDNSGYAIRVREFADDWDQSFSMIFSNGETNSEGDPMNGYEIAWWGWGGAYTKIRRWTNGGTTEIASVSDSDKNYVNHTLEFIWYNSNLLGYREDKFIINATDTTYTARTYIQLREWQDSSRYVDWILVRKYASPEPKAIVGQETVIGVFKAGSYGIGANTTMAFGSINNHLISGKISHGWNYIALTYDGSFQKLFVNGSLITDEIISTTINNNTSNLLIGFLFNGIIDELRIYNRSLSADEIKELYYQVVPKAPQNLNAEKERVWIKLTWLPPENNNTIEIEKYNIYRSNDGINYEVIGSSENTSYNDTSVEEGQTYYYYVVAITSSGIAGDVSEKIIVNLVFPPSSPLNLTAKAGDGYVNLTWKAPADNGGSAISQYKIYRNGTVIATVPANQLWYNDTSVKNGVTYIYYVTAVNSVGESEPSNTISAKPTSTGGGNPSTRGNGGVFPWLWIILGVIIAGILIGAILFIRKGKPPMQNMPVYGQQYEPEKVSQESQTKENNR